MSSNIFRDVIDRQAISQGKEQQYENLAARINSLDDLFQFHSDMGGGGMMRHDKQEHKLQIAVQNNINEIIQDAKSQNVDIPQTIQKFIRARDENQIFENISHLKNDIRGSIFKSMV